MGLEKYNSEKKEITQLLAVDKDKYCTEQTEILQEVVKFYSILYKRSDIDSEERSEYINVKNLPID